MSCSSEGWFLERHPKLAPVSTFTDGIFLAGCCQGPKRHPRQRAQAARPPPRPSPSSTRAHRAGAQYRLCGRGECSGCKSCIPLCPYTAISLLPDKKKATSTRRSAKAAAPACRVPVRLHRAKPLRGRRNLQRNRRSAGSDPELKIRISKFEIRNRFKSRKTRNGKIGKSPMPEKVQPKQYDLEERTFELLGRSYVGPAVARTLANIEDVKQLVRSSGSVGATTSRRMSLWAKRISRCGQNLPQGSQRKPLLLRLVFVDGNSVLDKTRSR